MTKFRDIVESQLDELSKKTLGSYIKKSAKDAEGKSAAYYSANKTSQQSADKGDYAHSKTMSDIADEAGRKHHNRTVGISRAVNRLTREELEECQLDELSKKTLTSYVNKATDSAAKAGDKASSDFSKPWSGPEGAANKASYDSNIKTRDKRRVGISKAIGKLTKEDESISESKTNNEGRGYHGEHPSSSADDTYKKAHAIVRKHTGASSREARDYLDSVHGRHLKGMESDHAYIKKDFSKFKKSYDPSLFEGESVMDFRELVEGQLVESRFATAVKKAKEAHDRGDEKRASYHLSNAKNARYSLKSTEYAKHKDHFDSYKELASKYDPKSIEESQLDEVKHMDEVPHRKVMQKIRDGHWEATHDVTPGRHLEIIDHTKNRKRLTINVGRLQESQLDELSVSKLDAYRAKAFADNRPEKQEKRTKGRHLAFDKSLGRKNVKVKATSEESQLDELSKDTLRSYSAKAQMSDPKDNRQYKTRSKGIERAEKKLGENEMASFRELVEGQLGESKEKIHTIDVDYDGDSSDKKYHAEKHGVKIVKTGHTPYSHDVHGTKKQLRSFAKEHYGDHEEAKDIHPEIYSKGSTNESQLDELSKKTLGSYIKKASTKRSIAGAAYHISKPNSEQEKELALDLKNSKEGIRRATDRLTREELEESQLDELSKKTLGSYVKKAAHDSSFSSALAGQAKDRENKRDLFKQTDKRLAGINRAVGKLTK